jgi:hypothetical protein
MASDQKMAVGCVRAKRLGPGRLAGAAAFATSAPAKAPEDWHTPRGFAPAGARPIFIVCDAVRGMCSDQRMIADCRFEPRILVVLVLVLEPLSRITYSPITFHEED